MLASVYAAPHVFMKGRRHVNKTLCSTPATDSHTQPAPLRFSSLRQNYMHISRWFQRIKKIINSPVFITHKSISLVCSHALLLPVLWRGKWIGPTMTFPREPTVPVCIQTVSRHFDERSTVAS